MSAQRTRAALAAVAAAALLAAGCATASGEPPQGAAGDQQAQEESSAPAATAGPDGSTEAEPRTAEDTAEDTAQDTSSAPEQDAAALAPWCRTRGLSASVRPLSPAAGNRYAALVLTNTSGSSCRTQGWTGLQLVDAAGAELPTDAVWDRSRPSVLLTVKPGASAWSRLHWSVVAGEEDDASGGCRPEPDGLEVIPPDMYVPTDAAWDLGPVCGGGRIDVLPLAAGRGPDS